mgnify:CR=1 FL=1
MVAHVSILKRRSSYKLEIRALMNQIGAFAIMILLLITLSALIMNCLWHEITSFIHVRIHNLPTKFKRKEMFATSKGVLRYKDIEIGL